MKRRISISTSIVLVLAMLMTSMASAMTVVQVKSIKFTNKALKVQVGKTAKLDVKIDPSTIAPWNLSWSSSNAAVANVKSDGAITGNRIGKAIITAKTKDGKVSGKTTVSVIAPIALPAPQSVKLTMYNPGGYFDDNTDNSKVMAEIQKKFLNDRNINLTINAVDLPWAGYEDRIKLTVAAGDQLDTFPLWASAAKNLIAAGFVKPLDDILEKNAPNVTSFVPEESWRFTTVDSKIYGFPRIITPTANGVIAVRKDWLNQYGLKMPTNITEIEKVAKVFKEKDPAGNGKTIPILFRYMNSGDGLMGVMFGTQFGYLDNNKLYNRNKNPNIKTALTYAKNWYADGLTSKEYLTLKGADFGVKQKQGIVGIFDMNFNGDYLATLATIRKVNPKAELEIVDLRDSKGKQTYYMGSMVSDFIMIPASSKNAAYVAQYYDWMCEAKENFMLANYGIKNVNYKEEGKKITLLGALKPDGWAKDYNGFFTGMFDMYGLPGYGRGQSANFVVSKFADPVVQAIYEDEYAKQSDRIDGFQLKKAPDYGFTYKLEGDAKATTNNRGTDVWNGLTAYMAGSGTWSDTQSKIDAYFTGKGGPEEIAQVNEQFTAFKKMFNIK